MTDRKTQTREIFEKAIESGDLDERRAFLNHACGGDESLRAEVEELIHSSEEATGILATRVHFPGGDHTPRTDRLDTVEELHAQLKPGTLVAGRYQLVRDIGKGGMGSVWLASQSEPVKRDVALKLIRSDLGSTDILARFDAERQVLAMMDHPNIARIFDGGTTEDGQPFFVMELVSGQPLTSYCDQNQLSIKDRLQLFIDICAGVQHAHQKGIIHRDLKPGNILVGQVDGKAVPKIIDFGLAKAMETTQRLSDQSIFTGIGQILGTLRYMSPEQAALDNLDIDIRADIYALGVILYELMTGSTPLDESSVKDQAALKILELIREKEAIKPSSRLGNSSDAQVSAIISQRQTDRSQLSRILAGDLDWIVMKALEKERSRRYESASGFAADVRRYLNCEPVVARPPSMNYRLRKFVRKNRVGVIAASLVTLALVAGLIGTGLGLREARKQTKEKDKQLQRAVAAEGLAEKRLADAERNLAFAKKGNEILGSVFADLDPKADYKEVSDLRIALQSNLGRAVNELQESVIGDPLEVANMQETLGRSLRSLGVSDKAIQVHQVALRTREQFLGPDHPDTLHSMNHLACALLDAWQLDKALPMLEQTLKLSTSKLGSDHPKTLTTHIPHP